MTTHRVKCWVQFYEAIERGEKTFDCRDNDRMYQKGDLIIFDKFDNDTGAYAHELDKNDQRQRISLTKRISYVQPGGRFGIEPGWVVLGLVAESTWDLFLSR